LGIIHISHTALITLYTNVNGVVFILAYGPWCITLSTVLRLVASRQRNNNVDFG